jgi:hypothetical protein
MVGDCGGDVSVLGWVAPAGLKEKAGRALTDLCLWCGIDPRRAVGYAWSETGRELVDVLSVDGATGARIGKENSGLGTSSTGSALEAC